MAGKLEEIQRSSSLPLPFAGIIRIRFIGLEDSSQQKNAPLAILSFIEEKAVFVNLVLIDTRRLPPYSFPVGELPHKLETKESQHAEYHHRHL